MEPENFWTRTICSICEVVSLIVGVYYLFYKSKTDKAISFILISLLLEKLGAIDWSLFSYFYWHCVEPKSRQFKKS